MSQPLSDLLTAYPFPGMLAYSAPGLLNPDFVLADGQTIVDVDDYPLATTVLSSTLPSINAIGYSSALGLYVAADTGDGGFGVNPLGFWYSSNGINWTIGSKFSDFTFPSADSPIIQQIIFADNRFVAVGLSSSSPKYSVIFTSLDGETWSLVKTLSSGSPQLYGVAFGDNKFITVGELSPASGDGIDYVSTDGGDTWTLGNFSPTTVAGNAIAYSEDLSLFVVAGSDGFAYTSADDSAWLKKAATDTNLTNIIWDATNAIFVATGTDSAAGAIVTSSDGVTFTPATYTGATLLTKIIYSSADSLYIAIDTSGTPNAIFTSANLTAWTSRYTDTNIYAILFAAADAPIKYLAGAVAGATQFAKSSDALTWENIAAGYGIEALVTPDLSGDIVGAPVIYIKLR